MPNPSRLLRSILTRCLPLVLLAPLPAKTAGLADFQALAAQSSASLTLPVYPLASAEVRAQADNAIKTADAALAALTAQDPARLSFDGTFGAYDAITGKVTDAYLILGTVAESSTDKAMRDTANEMTVKLQEWSVGLDYREDLYRILKAFADRKPALDREQQRLVDEQMRNYRRAGLALPAAERAEVERLRKDLAGLNTQFAVNINAARAPLDFTAAELAGVPPSFLESPGVKQPDGRYRVMANVTWHAVAIAENADNPETRRRVNVAPASWRARPTPPCSASSSCCAPKSPTGSATPPGPTTRSRPAWRRPGRRRSSSRRTSWPACSRNSPPRWRRCGN